MNYTTQRLLVLCIIVCSKQISSSVLMLHSLKFTTLIYCYLEPRWRLVSWPPIMMQVMSFLPSFPATTWLLKNPDYHIGKGGFPCLWSTCWSRLLMLTATLTLEIYFEAVCLFRGIVWQINEKIYPQVCDCCPLKRDMYGVMQHLQGNLTGTMSHQSLFYYEAEHWTICLAAQAKWLGWIKYFYSMLTKWIKHTKSKSTFSEFVLICTTKALSIEKDNLLSYHVLCIGSDPCAYVFSLNASLIVCVLPPGGKHSSFQCGWVCFRDGWLLAHLAHLSCL